ncbi:Hypothetical protein ADU72_0251 [Pediococcus damnosus]|uniref:DUF5067 domain-containing protein n=1 Tax=Pediococcus damnosus TaxID=51663 RepID=A0A0R2H9H8_9LACO|nr:hypothetical protein [Pediococcus damnosus]AMV59787.1 Hypothetical protein ADU69_0109 [Pediococcus damnosus]AMV61923.1 Hypothetical protein ADU70_0423 [Pediococcus damnosus]AMV64033.1 Hypothetical protein ADU71_0110 [Pediococcus damnosus]AMV66200.1 Hypothetical protein ADU72_0251 [Pediococcus damnosus]AMV68484.1 Hypothetical protein ADU73_0072 [Pediococcus damnosus]
MKKFMAFVLLGTLFLGGCTSQNADSHYQNKGKETFTNQNKNAHKKASSSSSKESSASSDSASTNSADNTKKSSSYSVPTKIKKSTNYVPHGDLTNKKQFSYDNFGTKLTLDKYKKTDQVIINRPLRYQISQTRLLKNEAKTAKAKKVVADAFNNTDISSTYYTLQLKYTVQNESNQMVIIGGLNYIKLSNDYAGTPISNMVDSVAGKKLAAGKKLNTNVVVLVPASLVHTLNSCTIQFSSAYSLSGKTLSKDSLDSKITF